MTRIVADTLRGLSLQAAHNLGIPMISQVTNFGEESSREGVDMDNAAFMARLRARAKNCPKPRPLPRRFYPGVRGARQAGGEHRVHHPSADVSGTVRSALTAKGFIKE